VKERRRGEEAVPARGDALLRPREQGRKEDPALRAIFVLRSPLIARVVEKPQKE